MFHTVYIQGVTKIYVQNLGKHFLRLEDKKEKSYEHIGLEIISLLKLFFYNSAYTLICIIRSCPVAITPLENSFFYKYTVVNIPLSY